jgi:hypothetical protein
VVQNDIDWAALFDALKGQPAGSVLFGVWEDHTHKHPYFLHVCRIGPELPAGGVLMGWHIIAEDPLTVEPSIRCAECGLHGFITDGQWRVAK